jgi:hypothetical protein
MKILSSFVLAACLAVPAVAAAQTATAADPVGTWNASFNTQNGVIPATLKLQKAGEKLAGSITSQEGETPAHGEYKDKTLKVWFEYQAGGNAIPIEMTGTIDGDSAKGTMTAGGNPAGDWNATRTKEATAAAPAASAPASATSLTGDWAVSLQLDQITASPSLTLKQDADKLTGEYISQQYGKFPVTGTVKGTELTFTVAMSIEGNAMNVVYNGVVQPDGSIKGGVDIGGAMSGTFSATRKK